MPTTPTRPRRCPGGSPWSRRRSPGWLDRTATRPVVVTSVCAGDGRDLLGVLAGRPVSASGWSRTRPKLVSWRHSPRPPPASSENTSGPTGRPAIDDLQVAPGQDLTRARGIAEHAIPLQGVSGIATDAEGPALAVTARTQPEAADQTAAGQESSRGARGRRSRSGCPAPIANSTEPGRCRPGSARRRRPPSSEKTSAPCGSGGRRPASSPPAEDPLGPHRVGEDAVPLERCHRRTGRCPAPSPCRSRPGAAAAGCSRTCRRGG